MKPMKRMKNCSVGIDGCKGKWVAVCLWESGFHVDKYNTIDEVLAAWPSGAIHLIDIPIGLAESLEQLRPDSAARKKLGRKGSSIFEAPCRQAVHAGSAPAAREWNKRILGKSLSAQSIGFSKAIREVDSYLEQHPEWKNRLLESHPELCFQLLGDGSPVMEKKTEEAGQRKRLAILGRYLPEPEKVISAYLSAGRNRKKADDAIDALSLAVMGQQILERGMAAIPEEPMADSRGLQMQIVYAKGLDEGE